MILNKCTSEDMIDWSGGGLKTSCVELPSCKLGNSD